MHYIVQPPIALNCNPLGVNIQLQCATDNGTRTWYWTTIHGEAGVSGTEIISSASGPYTIRKNAGSTTTLDFNVTESSLGYYWCQISGVHVSVMSSLRSSLITPVCTICTNSTNKCIRQSIINNHYNNYECAQEFPRPPLPALCLSYTSVCE